MIGNQFLEVPLYKFYDIIDKRGDDNEDQYWFKYKGIAQAK